MKDALVKRIVVDGLIVALLVASICAVTMTYLDRLHLNHLQRAEKLINTYEETFYHVVNKEPNMPAA